jgi:membrane protein
MAKSDKKFNFRHIPSLLKDAAIAWNKDNPWRLSAIIAYYAILSLPGLLVIMISLLGYFWGTHYVEGKLHIEIKDAMGAPVADAMQSIFEESQNNDTKLIPTILGIGALVFGATGVFYHLQISINDIWKIESDPKHGFLRYLIDRTRSFGFVLIISFLLLVSFVISALLSGFQDYIGIWLPELSYYFIQGIEIVFSLGVITILFALIYKYLPDMHIGWRSVWFGAFLAAILFTLGKQILSIYFGKANPGSAYGAAGSLIVILLWVSYSCLILFFGAEFTWVYTRRYGLRMKPKAHAKFMQEVKNEL